MPKINSYTVERKISIVRWHRAHGENESATSREFSIHRRQVHDWNLKFGELLAYDNSRDRKRRKLSFGQAPFNIELDDLLFDYFIDERLAGRAVTNTTLKSRALVIAGKLKLKNFKASTGYIRNFKKRFEISMRRGTNECQKKPEQVLDVLRAWRLSVRCKRREHHYTDSEIANMDQTSVRFDMPLSSTLEQKGKKTIRIKNTGHKKKGCTVALCATADGEKLPAYIVFKEPNGKLGKNVLKNLTIPDNVLISASLNGWMVAANLKHWCDTVWKQTEDPDQRRRLLILDQYKPHHSEENKSHLDSLHTDIILIPAGCTSLVQPADVSWNKPFKTKLHALWNKWMQLEKSRALTPIGNLKSASRQNIINWVSKAWNCVTSDVIIKSFLVTGISNSLDGSQDDFIRNSVDPKEAIEEFDVQALFDEADSVDIDDFEGFEDSDTDDAAIFDPDEPGPSSRA